MQWKEKLWYQVSMFCFCCIQAAISVFFFYFFPWMRAHPPSPLEIIIKAQTAPSSLVTVTLWFQCNRPETSWPLLFFNWQACFITWLTTCCSLCLHRVSLHNYPLFQLFSASVLQLSICTLPVSANTRRRKSCLLLANHLDVLSMWHLWKSVSRNCWGPSEYLLRVTCIKWH